MQFYICFLLLKVPSKQWGSYQIDLFSYRCDEHRQKFTFEIVFQRYVYVRTADFEVQNKQINERALCVLMVVGKVGFFFKQVTNVRRDMK